MARANCASEPEFAPPLACICRRGQGPPGDNEGFASIGALFRSKGSVGFGTRYRYRTDGSLGDDSGDHDGQALPVDLALKAQGLGAYVIRESWWQAPVAEVSESDDAEASRREHQQGLSRRRWHL